MLAEAEPEKFRNLETIYVGLRKQSIVVISFMGGFFKLAETDHILHGWIFRKLVFLKITAEQTFLVSRET